ncbi:hypothetical protein L21SP5_00952 [Salinivirga cyanobacteriivorans]|uniref:Uncharacterized protein n=1 Tax=Salinivirga cyanobacteriivorans TaxID=1307839 RepID=A0A0S2HX43_9BACT|nr:hypothetical protein [Salinivirga cyanobacteriivorans]ALO14616.1 hypothetical protein L21SP5_00949 [Salinivirga cyanobacteriivorans]ALO14619.1 hypothetical protein L21SP5_00952 [Salinivirga cyanobacteriivorans]
MSIYALYMGISMRTPSHSTISSWVKKVGYYQLEKKTTKKTNDWIVILDESVEFGHDKLLVVYGIRNKSVDFKRALNYQDLTPLAIISGDRWTGELIEKQLRIIEQEYGKILYAVADGGNAIKKALRLMKTPHVYDITHKLAWFLKEIYKPEEEFQSYITKMAKMRGALSLTNVSHILPPNQRFHSRFMNLDIISDWGMKVLNYLKNQEKQKREYKELLWVKNHEQLIQELFQVNGILLKIKALLKTQLSKSNIKKVKTILKEITIESSRIDKLKNHILNYLNELKALIPKQRKVICTSDIIESAFGKYKNYINNNPMIGITNLSLTMAAFTCQLGIDEIKISFEKVRNKDVHKWSEKNIGLTNMQRRKSILKKVG